MDVFLQKERGFEDTTSSADVPNHDLAKLMYYLRSVTLNCGLDILPDRLLDYPRWSRLSRADADQVYGQAYVWSPDELLGKVIYHDEDNDICQPPYNGRFLTLSEATSMFAVTGTAVVGGTSRTSSKVFVFQSNWLRNNYIDPMRRGKARLDRLGAQLTTHCNHCLGHPSACSCTSGCRRYPWASCTPRASALGRLTELIELLADATVTDGHGGSGGRLRHCDHCAGVDAQCGCDTCPRPAGVACINHCAHCWGLPDTPCGCVGGCARLPTSGCTPRAAHCAHCAGGPGRCACEQRPQCGRWPSSRCIDHCAHCWGVPGDCKCRSGCPRLDTSVCTLPQPPPPPPRAKAEAARPPPPRAAATAAASTTAPRPPPPPPPTGSGGFRVGQRVTLTGLSTATMNGHTAVVVDAVTGGGRAEVELLAGGAHYNIRYGNLRAAPVDLD